MEELDEHALDATVEALKASLSETNETREIPLQEIHCVILDAIGWREASARKTIKLAEYELKAVNDMKAALFRRTIVELGVDTSLYKVEINSQTKQLIVKPK